MTKRDELYYELIGIYWKSDDAIDGMYAIADFIIQRENDLMDEVEKPLKEILNKYLGTGSKNAPRDCIIEDGIKHIKKALSIINSKRGGK